MEFHQGKAGGWMLIGERSEEGIEDEDLSISCCHID